MQQDSIDYGELIRHLHASAGARANAEPSADLWLRIHGAQVARSQRKRRQRLSAVACVLAAGIAAAMFAPHWNPAWQRNATDVDWQARAQALELQLRTLSAAAPGDENPFAHDAESDLARIDSSLQTAYDNAADKNELVPLWKQRSELLNALVTARRQRLAMSRI